MEIIEDDIKPVVLTAPDIPEVLVLSPIPPAPAPPVLAAPTPAPPAAPALIAAPAPPAAISNKVSNLINNIRGGGHLLARM